MPLAITLLLNGFWVYLSLMETLQICLEKILKITLFLIKYSFCKAHYFNSGLSLLKKRLSLTSYNFSTYNKVNLFWKEYKNMCNHNSIGTALLISIIAGIAAASLFSFNVLTNITIGIYIVLAISALALFAILFLTAKMQNTQCSCSKRSVLAYAKYIIYSSVGAILSSVSALTITLSITSTASIIIIFLVATFFVLLLVSLINYFIASMKMDLAP